ncbi:MAG: response regulator transcription factor, partial [Desulfuromonadaceae bacterium]
MFDISGLSVLYVEDEPDLRAHVAFALRLHINSVLTAANGKEALAIIRSNRPDVVISDIRMPVMDGLELATSLRKEFPGLPLLFCTAFTDTDYLLKAIEL